MKTLIVLFAAAAFACGGTDGNSSSGTSVSGTVAGITFPAIADTASVVLSNSTCGNVNPPANSLAVDISSTGNICGGVSAGKTSPNSTDLILLMQTYWLNPGSNPTPTSSPAFAIKTYPIGFGTTDTNGFGVLAIALFDATDGTCSSKLSNGAVGASSGSITLTNISGSNVSGTYSLTFSSGTLTGSFSAPVCGVTAAQACNVVSGGTSTCGT